MTRSIPLLCLLAGATLASAQDYSATKVPAFPDPLPICQGASRNLAFLITDSGSPLVDNGQPTNYSVSSSSADLVLSPISPLSGTVADDASLNISILATAGAGASGLYTVDLLLSCSGCGDPPVTVSFNLNVSAGGAPTVEIVPTGTLICDGAPVELTAEITNDATGVNYLWSPGGQSTPSIEVTEPGLYAVQVANACGNDNDNLPIAANETPAPLLDAEAALLCDGATATLTALSTNGATGLSYSWAPGGQSTPSIEVSAAGTYTVTVSNECGSAMAGQLLETNETPTLELLASAGAICDGVPVDLTANLLGAATEVEFLWNTGTTGPSIEAGMGGTYSVMVSNACGADAAEVVLPEDLTPSVTIAASDTAICNGVTVSLEAVLGNSAGGLSYAWNTGASSSTITATTPDTYSVVVSNFCGSDSAEQEITAGDLPEAAITATLTTICDGQTSTLTAVDLAGASDTDISWNTLETTASIDVQTGGIYIVDIGNDCGISSDTVEVFANFAPQVEITPDTGYICDGNDLALTANITNGALENSYSWNTGDTTPVAIVDNTGNYWVGVSNQCGMGSDTLFDVVTGAAPVLFSLECTNPPGEIRINVRALDPQSMGLSFVWCADGVPIANGGDFDLFIGDQISRLKVYNADLYEGVAFSCKISNPCGTLVTMPCGLNLPVELLYFAGRVEEEDIVLSWATASETDNAFFTLERSGDGLDFQFVADVPGAGDSFEERQYKYVDRPGPIGGGRWYYRLKQTDFDGAHTYSEVIVIELDVEPKLSILQTNLDGNLLEVAYQSARNRELQLRVVDLNGRVLAQQALPPLAGFFKTEVWVDLPPGLYLLHLSDGIGQAVSKFLR